MKTVCLILLIAGCALVHGIAYASASDFAPRQSPENSDFAGKNRSSDAEHATPTSENKGHKEATAPNERGDSHDVPHKIHSRSRTSLLKTNRPKQPQNRHEPSRPGKVMNVQQPSLTKPAGAAGKIANHHIPAIRPTIGSVISGQQFGNGRDRGTTPAAIGGPADARRNVEAINGTEINNKHLN